MPLLDKLKGGAGAARGHMPVKRSINLATVGEKPISLTVALPAIILIILAAALLSKFAVIDRFSELYAMERQVAQLQRQLDATEDAIEAYGDLNYEYAHYTWADMTTEEMSRADRVEAMDMLQQIVLPMTPVDSWSITNNQLVLSLSGNTLESINRMGELIRAQPIVASCDIRNVSQSAAGGGNTVSSNVVIMLQKVERQTTESEPPQESAGNEGGSAG